MVKYCCAYACNSVWEPNKNFNFHRFPLKRPAICEKWIRAVKLQNFVPNTNTVICSKHFTSDCYLEYSAKKNLLKKDAVPTVFNFPSHLQKNPCIRRELIRHTPSTLEQKEDEEMETDDALPLNSSVSRVASSNTKDASVQTSPKKMQRSTIELNTANKIKLLKRKLKRRDQKISNMKDLIRQLKKNGSLTTDLEEAITNNFENLPLDLFKSQLRNGKVATTHRRYTESMKRFSLTLYFYSPKAYTFLRKQFLLPHPSMLRKWLATRNCNVGLLSEVFDYLQKNVMDNNHLKNVALIFDSMAIRKQLMFDAKSDKQFGYVDLGGVANVNSEELASEALVFQIVSYSTKFKVPVAYFFINKVSADVQSHLITVILKQLFNVGVTVRSITCDGCGTNLKTLQNLGCKVSNVHNFVSHFQHPSDKEIKVYCILDACHMLKLCRNSMAEINLNSEKGRISFSYVKKLHELQEKEDLKLANSLSGPHINFSQKKMNVRLAAQVISSSVADAIDFLRESGHPDFEGSSATTEFVRIFDRIFDLMNSRTIYAKGYKAPLFLKNKHYWLQILNETFNYIIKLNVHGDNIMHHPRKTFALGFLLNISSINGLATDLLSMTDPLKYFLTYKCSQDHLELYFSCIRSQGGWNNNPTALQFKWSLRKLLFSNDITPSANGNCLSLNFDSSPIFQFNYAHKIDQNDDNSHEDDAFITHLVSDMNNRQLSPFQENIVYYITGFLLKKFVQKNNCRYCHNLLVNDQLQDDHNYSVNINSYAAFTMFVNRGKLCFPSKALFEIIKCAEKAFRTEMNIGLKGKHSFKQRITAYVVMHFVPIIKKIFVPSHPVVNSTLDADTHEIRIIKYFVNRYAEMRMHTYLKKTTLRILGNNATLRHKLTKSILFYHV